jgi:hypothetical protein
LSSPNFFQDLIENFLQQISKTQNFEYATFLNGRKHVLIRRHQTSSSQFITVIFQKHEIQNLKFLNFFQENSKFQNSEYEVHQIDPKDLSLKNVSCLAFKLTSAGVIPSSNNGDSDGALQTNFFLT